VKKKKKHEAMQRGRRNASAWRMNADTNVPNLRSCMSQHHSLSLRFVPILTKSCFNDLRKEKEHFVEHLEQRFLTLPLLRAVVGVLLPRHYRSGSNCNRTPKKLGNPAALQVCVHGWVVLFQCFACSVQPPLFCSAFLSFRLLFWGVSNNAKNKCQRKRE
jgi:hypothetical protein